MNARMSLVLGRYAGIAREPWRRNLLVIWLCVFTIQIGIGLIYPFLPFYLEDLGVHGAGDIALWTGVLGAAHGVAMFIFSPVWGWMGDRIGRKPMLMRSAFAGVAVMALQAAATNPWHLLIMRILHGIFLGSTAAAAALVASGTPRPHLSRAMGYMSMATFVSQVSGPMVGGLLVAVMGFRRTFLMTAVFYLAAALLVFFFARELANPDASAARGRRGKADARLLANRGVLLMLAVLVFVYVAPSLSRPVIPLVLRSFNAAASAGQAGIVFSATALASATAAVIAGRMGGRFGAKRTLVAAMIGAGAAYLPVTRVDSLPHLVILMSAVGLFSGGLLPSCNTLLGAFAPTGRQGAVFGLAASAQALAIAVGPVSGGLLASTFGIRTGFAVSGLLLLGLALVVSLVVRDPGSEDAGG